MYTIPITLIAIVVLTLAIARSLLIGRLTSRLPGEERAVWQRLARYLALLQLVHPFLLLTLGFIFEFMLGGAPQSMLSVVILAMYISWFIDYFLFLPLLAYAGQLARRTGRSGHRLGRLALISAILAPLLTLFARPLGFFVLMLAMILQELFATIPVGEVLIYTFLLVEPLTIVWVGVVLWLVAGRIDRVARRV